MSAITLNERILRVMIYIQTHLDEAMSLDELADVAHVSRYYFHRMFRAFTGEPVYEHIRRLRLERAAGRLMLSEESVGMIAFDAGFETHEAFTRAFKAKFGQSPQAYRKSEKERWKETLEVDLRQQIEIQLHKMQLEDLEMDVRIVDLEPRRVAFCRHIGPYEGVHGVWADIMSWAHQNGLVGRTTEVFGLTYDDPHVTEPDRIRYDACVVVNDDVQPVGSVGVQEVSFGRCAVFRHKGAYDRLDESYKKFFVDWLMESGYELRDYPSMNVHVNHPHDTPTDELLTDVYVPLV